MKPRKGCVVPPIATWHRPRLALSAQNIAIEWALIGSTGNDNKVRAFKQRIERLHFDDDGVNRPRQRRLRWPCHTRSPSLRGTVENRKMVAPACCQVSPSSCEQVRPLNK